MSRSCSHYGSSLLAPLVRCLLLLACAALVVRGRILQSAACSSFELDCEGCLTGTGCLYCPADGSCVDALLPATSYSTRCVRESDFVSSGGCTPEELYQPKFDGGDAYGIAEATYSDPLYAANGWVFKMINILPVWQRGIRGTGVRVRVNDSGIKATHAEFKDRFDIAGSCDDDFYTEQNPHGTFVASIVAAEADNGSCSVGIAPGVTISSCNIFNDVKGDNPKSFELAAKVDRMDISQNSFGPTPCRQTRRRRLQRCPFQDPFAVPCSLCDFSQEPLSDVCRTSIIEYCERFRYRGEHHGCLELVDVYANDDAYSCEFDPIADEELAALRMGIVEGRGGKGIIYVFASGNEALDGVDVNFVGFLNTRFTISVGAVTPDGRRATYSNGGAALLVSAPGGGFDVANDFIVAGTASTSDCMAIEQGTSLASPVVSGIIALMLEVNPNLSWRDVQGILVATSEIPEELDEPAQVSLFAHDERATNAAGLKHSLDYGFGIVNAAAAVAAAESWYLYGAERSIVVSSSEIGLDLVDDAEESVTTSLLIDREITGVGEDTAFVVESVSVFVDVRHIQRGDLEIVLTSPEGTSSRLTPGRRNEFANSTAARTDPDDANIVEWELMTVRSWGESPIGSWELTVTDRSPGSCFEESAWTSPAIDDGCRVLDDVFGACQNVVPTSLLLTPTADTDRTAFTACCRCGGGEQVEDGTCRDLDWTFPVAKDLGCRLLDIAESCDSDAWGTAFLQHVDDGGSSGQNSCCRCGGGRNEASVSHELVQWRLAIYGRHVSTNTPSPTPLLAEVGNPTATESAPANAPSASAPSPFENDMPTSETGSAPATQNESSSSVVQPAIFHLVASSLASLLFWSHLF